MSKDKNAIGKLFEQKKQEAVEKAQEKIEELPYTAYDVVQDPDSKNRSFMSVKIKYDLKTNQAVIAEVRPFDNKTAGLAFVMDKDNRAYLFENKNAKETK